MANKYKEVELLHREADELRKDAHDKWKKALGGKLTVPGVSQDYLMEVAFAIEDYSMWIQGKPLEVDFEKVGRYRELIKVVKRLLP